MDPQQQPPPYQPATPYSPLQPQVYLPQQQPAATQPFAPQPPFPATGVQLPINNQQPANPPAIGVAEQVAQQISAANNVLVTVSNSPSVDQLCAAVGMALLLNKLGKHATAVFSGTIPPAIDFLQPEKTLEKNTDSLRDFIIALDKAKADKLRYKIEDKYVKIFITPYRTSIDQKDLQFSQGDLNVDVVIALGVKTQNELDQAITAHGQILHDATIISINHQPGANLGSINWNETRTSSLSELVAKLAEVLQPSQPKKLLDKQVATALLTGAVAETDRFSNSKTTPETMTMAAKLMDAGANQPLIANKLAKLKPIAELLPKKPAKEPKQPSLAPTPTAIKTPPPVKPPAPKPPDSIIDADGSLHISHEDGSEDEDDIDKIHIDDQGVLQRVTEEQKQAAKKLTANKANTPSPTPQTNPSPTSPPNVLPAPSPASEESSDVGGIADEKLSEIEQAVNSPHLNQPQQPPASQPPAGPGPAAAPPLPSPGGPSISNARLGPDPSLPPITNVKSLDDFEAPGSVNVNSPDANSSRLFSPGGQSLSTAEPGTASPLAPPPVPPPMTPITGPDATSTGNNLSDPNAGVPL